MQSSSIMMDVTQPLDQRPPPLSKQEYDDAVSRNLYVWSQWRIDVNKALIHDLQTGQRNPVRPLDEALKDASIFDDPDSRKKIDDPTTLLNYCSALNQNVDFKPSVFLQFGIPRARISQRDASSSPPSSKSDTQTDREPDAVSARNSVPFHQQDQTQRKNVAQDLTEREPSNPNNKGPARPYDINNQDPSFSRHSNDHVAHDTRERYNPNTRSPRDDHGMIVKHPGGYDKRQFNQLPKRVYPEVQPLSHPQQNLRHYEGHRNTQAEPLSSQNYGNNIDPVRGQSEPRAQPSGYDQGYADRANPRVPSEPTIDPRSHPDFQGVGHPREYDQPDQKGNHGYPDRHYHDPLPKGPKGPKEPYGPSDPSVYHRHPDPMYGRPRSPQNQSDLTSPGNITDPPPRGQRSGGQPDYHQNRQGQPDLRGHPGYTDGPPPPPRGEPNYPQNPQGHPDGLMRDPRYDADGRPHPPPRGQPLRGQPDYPQNPQSNPDGRMSDPRYDASGRPHPPPRGQPDYPQNPQGQPDGPMSDPRYNAGGRPHPPARGQPGYLQNPQGQPALMGNPGYTDGPMNDPRYDASGHPQPPRGQSDYPQNPHNQPDLRGNPMNDPRYRASPNGQPARGQPNNRDSAQEQRPLPLTPDPYRSHYARGILDSEFYKQPGH